MTMSTEFTARVQSSGTRERPTFAVLGSLPMNRCSIHLQPKDLANAALRCSQRSFIVAMHYLLGSECEGADL